MKQTFENLPQKWISILRLFEHITDSKILAGFVNVLSWLVGSGCIALQQRKTQ